MLRIFLVIYIFFSIVHLAQAQTTIDPSSITLGIDEINMVDGDTILHWGKKRSAFRGGFYTSADITNANTGLFSFAYGSGNQAGDHSVAMGFANRAEGPISLAIGDQNQALATSSITLGQKNIINNRGGIAIGEQLIINSDNVIALGRFNIDFPDPPNAEDKPIFFLGNGDGRTPGSLRSNAISVFQDGRMALRASTPLSDLHMAHANVSASAGFTIQNEAGGTSSLWWRFYTRSLTNELALYNDSFMGGTSAVGEFNTSGSYSGPSDRRLKKDIIDLPYGLEDVLKLSPKRYQFKHVEDRLDIGLIAQDVIEVIPELVSYDEQDDKYMMNYDGFGVLAIKAIQELHDKVELQQETIDLLIKKLAELSGSK